MKMKTIISIAVPVLGVALLIGVVLAMVGCTAPSSVSTRISTTAPDGTVTVSNTAISE